MSCKDCKREKQVVEGNVKVAKVYYRYLRDNKRRPYATICAVVDDERIGYGWSLCHKRDQFSKAKGRMIAYGRANSTKWIEFPQTIRADMSKFMEKMEIRFKMNMERVEKAAANKETIAYGEEQDVSNSGIFGKKVLWGGLNRVETRF